MQLDVVNPSTAVSEMKAGNYDIAKLSSDEYPTYADATNFKNIRSFTECHGLHRFQDG